MQQPPILFLIDDDDDDRELFGIALSDLPYKTTFKSASSGPEGLLLLIEGIVKPDYIFLDLNMPQMDGKECLQELKKTEALAGIPVIIYSTSNIQHDIDVAREMGAIDFITKPAKVEELTHLLDHFLINHLHTQQEK